MLSVQDALLTDTCINGLSALLQAIIGRDPQHLDTANQCVIFSSYDLVRIHYKVPDAELWRSTYRREYWKKKIWIIPIHRQAERHWVLAVLHLESKVVHLYDSLGMRQSAWNQDVKVWLP